MSQKRSAEGFDSEIKEEVINLGYLKQISLVIPALWGEAGECKNNHEEELGC